MKHPIGHTSNGFPVYVDLIHSQAAQHISSKPHLLTLVKEAVKQIKVTGPELKIEYDMGHPIGYDFVVQTTDEHTILYAQILREDIYTRFAKNGRPVATSYLTMVLRHDTDNGYELHDTWIGRIHPPRPGSDSETPESKSYWENHAYILDAQQLQIRTVTKVCPY